MALNQICSQYVRGKKSGTVLNGYGKKGALISCIKCFVHLLKYYSALHPVTPLDSGKSVIIKGSFSVHSVYSLEVETGINETLWDNCPERNSSCGRVRCTNGTNLEGQGELLWENPHKLRAERSRRVREDTCYYSENWKCGVAGKHGAQGHDTKWGQRIEAHVTISIAT